MKFLRHIAAACALSAAMAVPCHAASISDFDVSGWESVDEGRKADIERAISGIPECVPGLYRIQRGHISFVDRVSPDAYGMYHLDSNLIEVGTEEESGYPMGSYVLVHELGHFLYRNTRTRWSDEALASLRQMSSGWQILKDGAPAGQGLDTDEAFACMYELYYTHQGFPAEDIAAVVTEAERACQEMHDAYPKSMEAPPAAGGAQWVTSAATGQ